ncbi:hypothetical protein QLQ12_39090 [Actinoplanes sp. NEAU-A12]|uniref:Uncharacterized protein n=1 Tax=Actinoplanes sandaracinus TaxID=3045177 RepID=A0ABT6WY47_9ACTN|nr:hypothetical protein [Actinoplanes sandaracinus]MDI6104614.1 hypothetical protein [Actinoplanes sandaracinus]
MLLGSQPIANDLWLAIRDQLTKMPVVSSWLEGLGLGTALLAELITADPAWMRIHDGEAFLNPHAPWGDIDSTLYELAWVIGDERKKLALMGRPDSGVDVRDLLRFLAGTDDEIVPRAATMLEGQLDQRGNYVRRTIGEQEHADNNRVVDKGRLALGNPPLAVPVKVKLGLWKTAFRHMPLNPNHTGLPSANVNRAIRRGEPLTPQEILLIALFDLIDITRRAGTVGVEYWPSREQCQSFLPPQLNELLELADEVKDARVVR